MKAIATRFWCAVCGKWVKPLIFADKIVCPQCRKPVTKGP